MNLFSGCMAVVSAFHFNETIGAMQGYEWAFLFIGLATVFDFCDGLSARLLHAYSALGKELDSLSDLVSFGVRPPRWCSTSYSRKQAHGWLFWHS